MRNPAQQKLGKEVENHARAIFVEAMHRWQEMVQSQGRKPRSALSFEVDTAKSLSGITHQQVSRWRNNLRDEAKYRVALFGPSYKKAMAGVLGANRGVETTHENEWFTPREYIELARDVLGTIDKRPRRCVPGFPPARSEWQDRRGTVRARR